MSFYNWYMHQYNFALGNRDDASSFNNLQVVQRDDLVIQRIINKVILGQEQSILNSLMPKIESTINNLMSPISLDELEKTLQ